MSIEPRKVIITALTVFIVGFFVYENVNDYQSRKEVLRNHSFARAHLVRYTSVSDGAHKNLTYSYTVAHKTYFRTIDPHGFFSECLKDFSLCENKWFVVMLSNENPEKSLIDLTQEIQADGRLPEPENIDHFR